MKFRSLALIVIAAVAFTPQISWSHPMPSSTVFLDIYETGVKAEINIPLSELGLALGENLRGDPQRIVATYGSQFASYFPRHIGPLRRMAVLGPCRWMAFLSAIQNKR